MSTALRELHKCWKPDCFRKVSTASRYCCTPCSYADEKKFELDDSPDAHPMMRHSDACEQRKTERGEYDYLQALTNKQTGAL